MTAVSAIILAAGKGTRMKSETPKVLHNVCNKPMLWYILSVARKVTADQKVVVGHGKNQVEQFLKENFNYKDVTTTVQEKQLGTGHAVLCTKNNNFKKNTLILLGDTPMITEEELEAIINYHNKNNSVCTVLTVEEKDPTGYGRIIRAESNKIKKIVEEADANSQQKGISEINTGIMLFNTAELFTALDGLGTGNNQGEYYLTDVIENLYNQGKQVLGFQIENAYRTMGINDRVDLSHAERLMRKEINEFHMQQGVTIVDSDRTYIDPEVTIGQDSVIYPNTILRNNSQISSFCTIGPETDISNSIIKESCSIEKSKIIDSEIHSNVNIGPYAQIRPGSVLYRNVKVGNFVEIKNSTLREGSKANHLAYIGDADIGKKVNLGAGSIIVNYDGEKKHRTTINDGAFIGCNSNLVAPVTIKENAFVAAGSTITDEVPKESLAIARSRQTIKEDWVKNNRTN
ncbi:bifunctional UDP-N-acetylglucosamine diphosphorylase/glucosamine-1-phosphate N-acetyltransferase GlmU [Natranaerobius trueperi]|uniref:Bifunctional protein GlmU n=1 Tax=Natranaerobius trueperi TaxID=759412 RepID=A0A226BXM5_9FIRM|nr:bifunctional UDP-N-acetylglucosamine diphosphorylase/glucosamine-1-phosphate N-acetyltransferase GlmU [Natranaerobius trueperi]OWZ83661.1 UDP-N-acetylglucosamine diphosphorylase/glucosamine-1-phosphate N-acetyltransferase [Natranaerobius trueperi]